jgi:hypothetical protein
VVNGELKNWEKCRSCACTVNANSKPVKVNNDILFLPFILYYIFPSINFYSTFNLQPSTFNLQPSTFNLQPLPQ